MELASAFLWPTSLLGLTVFTLGGLFRNRRAVCSHRFHTDILLCQWVPARAETDPVLDIHETM